MAISEFFPEETVKFRLVEKEPRGSDRRIIDIYETGHAKYYDVSDDHHISPAQWLRPAATGKRFFDDNGEIKKTDQFDVFHVKEQS